MTNPTSRAYVSPISILSALITVLLLIVVTSCADDNGRFPGDQPAGTGISINLTAGSMLPQVVTSRAEVENKTDEEKRINTIHLFFFDADGNFLTPTDPDKFAPYVRYDFTGGRPQSVAVPSDAFVGQSELTGVKIVALANLFGTSFRTEWTPDGDILYGEPDDPTREVTVSSLADLRSWLYRPQLRDDITRLPAPGMPMVGETLTAPSLAGTDAINIHLSALMARVDVEIGLDANQTNTDGTLPALTVTRYGIISLPRIVPLFLDDPDSYVTRTDGDGEILTEEKTVDAENVTKIFDKGTKTEFTYYTYENVRRPAVESFQYPDGVADDPAVRQRWKPRLANAHASALVIYGDYITHQGLGYGARFKFYLGSNTVDNFEVRRNRCYKNNITIRGLDYVRNTDEDVYTFDARVNVTTDNPLYISIVNERRIDAHWAVVPMDIYFLDNAPQGATCHVKINDPATSWVHLDYHTAEGIPDEEIKAGWGCADYFYTDMLQRYPDTEATARCSRDRIYFYVDENASETARTAYITLTYDPGTGNPDDCTVRTMEFNQAGLLRFTSGNTTYYMETYEEYAEHRDPLDTHLPSPWYQPDGIPWAREGSPLAIQELGASYYKSALARSVWKPYETTNSDGISMVTLFYYGYHYKLYNEGFLGMGHIDEDEYITASGVQSLDNLKIYPQSTFQIEGAMQYAFGKNKRDIDGNVKEYTWFLPGIGELESMLTSFSNSFPSFRERFYWSASTAKNPNNTGSISEERENWHRARASKLDSNGNPVSSGDKGGLSTSNSNRGNDISSSDDYNAANPSAGGGRTLRTQPLRVRAIRIADGVTTN